MLSLGERAEVWRRMRVTSADAGENPRQMQQAHPNISLFEDDVLSDKRTKPPLELKIK